MASSGPAAEAARAAFRAGVDARGRAADTAQQAAAGLEAALAAGSLIRTPEIAAMLDDLGMVLSTSGGARLGGKSAEAARRILQAISRELERA